MVPRSPHPGADLRTAIDWALEREGALFTAGERAVLERMLALSADALELYARLSLRVGQTFRVATLEYCCASRNSIEEIVDHGLADDLAPESEALDAFPAEELRAACARLGLPRSGRRAELAARLAGQPWLDESLLRVRHHALLDRVERLGGFDRRLAPAERIAGLRWEDYTPTAGSGAFADRRAMRLYERARRGELSPEEAVEIATQPPPPWGRSPHRRALEAVLATRPAADLLVRLPGCSALAARALEAENRPAEALALCRASDPDPGTALALARTGRRLARQLGAPWVPQRPPSEARIRRLRLQAAGSASGRPLWVQRGGERTARLPVESAVLKLLHDHGRAALHAENWFWTGVFALVFRPLYWLPLPGALPSRRRSGPVDLGTPSFASRRHSDVEIRLKRLYDEGFAPLAAEWRGERLDGLFRAEEVVAAASTLDGALIGNVLRPMLKMGWPAARGLPDLLVLPGKGTRVEAAFPAMLPECAFFAEIKGPTDTLRDHQRAWHAHLVDAGICVEVWMIGE